MLGPRQITEHIKSTTYKKSHFLAEKMILTRFLTKVPSQVLLFQTEIKKEYLLMVVLKHRIS